MRPKFTLTHPYNPEDKPAQEKKMSPKNIPSHPIQLEEESVSDVLSLVEDLAKNKDAETLVSDVHIELLLAAEAIRQLQTLAFESSRIADSSNKISNHLAQISKDFNHLVNTDIPDLANRSSDFVTALFVQVLGVFVNQSSDMRNMLKQASMDSIFATRDMVGILSLILKKLPKIDKE